MSYSSKLPTYRPCWLDEPNNCCRPLKPGVQRKGHKWTDHTQYGDAAEDEPQPTTQEEPARDEPDPV